jgi:NTP pyrophosphatase (non-canonical NTP hydrolase)
LGSRKPGAPLNSSYNSVMTMPEASAVSDVSLRQLAEWAQGQARRLAADFGFDSSEDGGRAHFALAQAVKLGEEVGELHAEVLGALKYQRREKAGQYNSDTLEGEIADAMVCLALLAQVLDVDLARAVNRKIQHLEARNRQAEVIA